MRIDKKTLREDIEEIIAEGVWKGEEVKKTTRRVLDRISDLIRAYEIELESNYKAGGQNE